MPSDIDTKLEQRKKMTPKGQFELVNGAADDDDTYTLERRHFINGAYEQLQEQLNAFKHLVGELARIRARLDLSERNLVATRDYLLAITSETDEELPPGWNEVFHRIRFVGMPLGQAAVTVLRESERALTTREINRLLNAGEFRFRTGTPLREINAALLRQPRAMKDKESGAWFYVPEEKEKAIA